MAVEKYIKNYINGALVPALSGQYLENINPATGKVYAEFADCNEHDLEQTVEYAERAFPEWAAMESERRFRILMRIADVIEQNTSEYARAESIDTGKPLTMSLSQDVSWAQACFRYYATKVYHSDAQSRYQDARNLQFSIRQPIGVVGCLIPWNMPLYQLCRKVAPALATGNCVIAKPSQWSPMTAYLLAQACEEAGLPKGVLNILQGKDQLLQELIVEHPKIRAITYTGDANTGRRIIESAAKQLKKCAINIGGNNATIIFADCDFDQMMIGTLRSSFSNNGHHQHHASRVLVERTLYEQLKTELVKRTQFLKVGDPFSSITDLGAIISETQLQKIKSYLTLVEVEGGTILCGGKPLELTGELENGFFIRPAVVEGLANDAKFNQEEVYAPIVSIQPFDTQDEAIELANTSVYGLSASVWTSNLSKAYQVSERLRVKTVWINGWLTESITLETGGVYQSGLANEGGHASLLFFTEAKEMSVRI